jgi:FkbM family methyltransferase
VKHRDLRHAAYRVPRTGAVRLCFSADTRISIRGPVTRLLRKIYDRLHELLGRELPPPYEAAQEYTERRLHEFLRCEAKDVRRVMIVGGFQADEVLRMMPRYPAAEFAIFEPSRRQIDSLTARFTGFKNRVTVVNAAASDVAGRVSFHEADAPGNGSLLPLGDAAKSDYRLTAAETYEVDAVRLDQWCAEHPGWADGPIDLIWCDVQGAELKVLTGAGAVLDRTTALFLEVSIRDRMYQGNVLYAELLEFLPPRGFQAVLLGVDPKTLTGNALLVKIQN